MQNMMEIEGISNVGNGTVPTVKSGLSTSLYKTVPPDFPEINVSVPANGTGDGYLFIDNFSFGLNQSISNYLLILDDYGEPVFYQKNYALDFKKQPNGWLTY